MSPILWYSVHMEESITPQITPEDAKRVQLQFLTQLHEAVPRTAPDHLTGLPAIHWSEYRVSSDQQPIPLDPPANWMPFMPLPVADVVVLTWTKAEWAALNQIRYAPGTGWKKPAASSVCGANLSGSATGVRAFRRNRGRSTKRRCNGVCINYECSLLLFARGFQKCRV